MCSFSTLDFFTLKSRLNGCPVQRLREISRTVKASDHMLPLPHFYIWLHSTVTLLPLRLVYLLTRSLVFTAVMSNGTGLQEELHVIGKVKLVDIIPGLGLAHATCGKLSLQFLRSSDNVSFMPSHYFLIQAVWL